MVVSLNSSWKVPTGYFFIDGLNGDERASLINHCINNKGAPVARRTNDPGQRRRSEADDLIHMLTLLDVDKIAVPKCVISDPDRIPSTPSCSWNTASCMRYTVAYNDDQCTASCG